MTPHKPIAPVAETEVSATLSSASLLADHFARDPMSVDIEAELIQLSSKLDIKDFKPLKLIGKGTFGRVMLVEHVEEGRIFAVKTLKKRHIIKSMQVEHTKSERRLGQYSKNINNRIVGKIEHPFIVPLRYAFQTKLKLYMVILPMI